MSTSEFSQIFSDEMTCPICLEEFKEPKCLTSCAHNVCRECLERMAIRGGKEISCPTCRRSTVIPEGGIKGLPTSTILVRLLEATPGRRERFDIQKALETGRPVVKVLEKKISKLEKSSNDLASILESLEKDIHDKADQICEPIVLKQEESFCVEAKEFYQKKQAIINHQKNNLIKLHSNAANSVQLAEEVLAQSNSKELVDRGNALVQQLEHVAKLNLEEAADFNATFKEELVFDFNEEVSSILRIRNIGKICTATTLHKEIQKDLNEQNICVQRNDQLSACTATSKLGMSGVMLPPCSSSQSTATANNDDNIYESMARQDYNLPKRPSRMEDLPPPPTYSEAVKLNTPDEWVVIQSPSNQTVKGVSTTINGLSGLNISENGTNFDEKGISDHGRPSKYEVKKYGGKGSGDTNGELINMEYLNAKGMTTVTTTSACSSLGVARDNPKTAYPKISDSQPSNGYVKGNQETPRLTGESAYYKDLTASDVSSKRRTSPRSDQLSASTATSKPGMSGVMLPPCSSPQSTATEPLSREVPPLHQSTATESLSREAPPLQYSHTQTSPHAYKYLPSKEATKNVCAMCINVPTHYCNICAKLCCSSCVSSLNRLPCDGAQIHHIVERSRPSSTKEKDIHKQEDVCVNCNKPSTHECSICKIKCCNVCQHYGTFKEKCTSSIGHVFIPAKSDAALYNGLALHREIQKDLNEQSICVQCGLSAKFICADCHNIVCKVCLDIFKRDLCPATKKEHFFQIIMAQTQTYTWSCKRCTYVNPPENRICSMCATSQGVTGVVYPESRKCGVCTYGNKEGARICAMCNRSLGLDKAESYL